MRRPSTLPITRIDAVLVAGPAMSNTSAAPGDNPLSISAAAIGIDPVAQRYIGIEKSSTTAIFSSGLSANEAKKLSGTRIVISPATSNPSTSQRPMSWIISTNP